MNRKIDRKLLTSSIIFSWVILASTAHAQIIPDATLPTPSTTTPNCTDCLIDGGTVNGTTLFHSFQEFSIATGGRAFFNQSPQIQNILTRVTGSSISNIDGLIETNPNANLFFLNPNGIIFGKNAQLKIGGSFFATTADSFRFPDGSEFSATNPQAPPLLAVTITPGLQYDQIGGGALQRSSSSGVIASQATLQTSQDLTLVASSLELQGQLQAENNITLIADTVKIQSNTAPFTAKANGNLLIQGNQSINVSAVDYNSLDYASLDYSRDAPFSHLFEAGNVTLKGGTITLNELVVDVSPKPSQDFYTDENYYGTIDLTSLDGSIFLTDSTLQATNDGLGFAGDILLNAFDEITIQSSQLLNAGSTGNIFIGNRGDGTLPTARTIVLDNASLFNQTDKARGEMGSIILNASHDIHITNGSTISAVTSSFEENADSGSNTSITAPIVSIDYGSTLKASTDGLGDAGNIRVNASSLWIKDAMIAAQANRGRGGDIDFSVETASLDNSVIRFGASDTGDAGFLTINAQNLSLLNNSSLEGDVSQFRGLTEEMGGRGGAVNLRISDTLLLDGGGTSLAPTGETARITVGVLTGGKGNGGNVDIEAGSFIMQNGAIIKNSAQGDGNAGKINIDADRVDISGSVSTTGFSSGLFAGTDSIFNANDITINAGSFRISDGAALSTQSRGSGNGGNIIVNATGTFEALNGGQLLATTLGKGNAGNIAITADQVTLDGVDQNYEARIAKFPSPTNSFVTNNIKEGAESGLLVSTHGGTPETRSNGGNIAIAANSLSISNGAKLEASTGGFGDGGNIIITAPTQIVLDRSGSISSKVDKTGVGHSGNITLTTDSLSLKENAILDVATSGQGAAGNIEINAQAVTLSGQNSRIDNSVRDGAIGNGGTININTNRLLLTDSAQLSASTSGQGKAGDVYITGNERVMLSGNRTTLSANASENSTDDGGKIDITTPELIVKEGAKISASTVGQGNAGNITISAANGTVKILDPSSELLTRTASNTGKGGEITIEAGSFEIANFAKLNATTTAASTGGSITVKAQSFEALSGGQLSTTSSGGGQAGDIRITTLGCFAVAPCANRMTLSGSETGLYANTTSNSTGAGGSIFLTAKTLTIQNSAKVAVDSRGTGQGGNIEIQTEQLALKNRALLSAETASARGGNLAIQTQGILFLRQGSLISASAGAAQTSGDGGNIAIASPFIVGVLSEDSDIRANAFTGKGGNIEITAQGIFGLKFQSEDTPRSDITASSQFGVSGQVILNTLNIDPSRGLVALPTNLVDPSNQISQSCSSSKSSINQFTVTGRGGLPSSPSDLFTGNAALVELTPVSSSSHPATSNTANPGQSLSPRFIPNIVEAQGWIEDQNGDVSLVAQVPTAAPHSTPVKAALCQPSPTNQ